MRRIILSAVLTLSGGVVGAAELYKPATPQPIKGIANTRIAPKHAYEVSLAKPLSGKKTVKTGGVTWQCAGDSCQGKGASPAPADADCKELAKQIGKLTYCGKKGGYRPSLKTTPALKGIEPLKKPVQPTQSLQPGQLKLKSGNDTETPDSPSAPAIRIPHTVTTRPLEIIGSPNPPRAAAEFSPMTVTTRALAIIGSPDLPREARPFKPITVTTTPLEVIGTPVSRGD